MEGRPPRFLAPLPEWRAPRRLARRPPFDRNRGYGYRAPDAILHTPESADLAQILATHIRDYGLDGGSDKMADGAP